MNVATDESAARHEEKGLKLAIGDACFRFRAISVVPVILLILFLFDPLDAGRFNPGLNLLGFLIALAGAATRIVAAGYAKPFTSGRENYLKAESLNTSGVYSIVRNPLYVGNFLVYNGILIAYSSPAALAFFNVFFILNYYFIILSEENYLQGQFGDAYREYLKSGPQGLSALRPLPQERPSLQPGPGRIQGKKHDALLGLLLRRLPAGEAVQAQRRSDREILVVRRSRPGLVRAEHHPDSDKKNQSRVAATLAQQINFQIPSTKFQISIKLQSANDPNRENKHSDLCFGHWDLELGIFL